MGIPCTLRACTICKAVCPLCAGAGDACSVGVACTTVGAGTVADVCPVLPQAASRRASSAKDSHSNKLTTRGRFLRFKGIIPLTMESVSDDVQRRKLFVGHLDASRIGPAILHGSDCQPF